MKKFWKSYSLVLVILFLVLSLGACGGKNDAAESTYSEDSWSDINKTSKETEIDVETPETDAVGEDNIGVNENGNQKTTGQKLITTSYVDAETEAYDQFMEWMDEYLTIAGGYVENSDVYSYEESQRRCDLTIRIPAETLGEFLAQMSLECNVLQSSRQEEDVTLNYVDAESHKSALLVEQERLLELLSQAENLEDILAIEDRLTSVRYQLQNYESTLRVYDNQINYATLQLSLREVGELTMPPSESWLARAWAGMCQNAKDIGRFFQEFGLFLVVHLPTILLLGLVILLILFFTRKPRKRAQQQREMIKAQQKSALQEMANNVEKVNDNPPS